MPAPGLLPTIAARALSLFGPRLGARAMRARIGS